MLNVLLSVLFATRGIQNRKLFCFCSICFHTAFERFERFMRFVYSYNLICDFASHICICYFVSFVISSLFYQIVLLQSKIQTQILQLHMAKMV
ncbi:hypothetical protein CJ213_03985 [Gardnerella swidsinskii]|uniref:Uncharacterized protein n=1 Tax=Gardnerella swidsinskii TaxID=2792979 RepID=A0A9X7FFX9_9BIFI|nr:hypothetical protein CJ213_03985 [Gardnerella swidsinskii]